MTDELLVIRCQLGERDAFAELVGAWNDPVWTYVRRMLVNEFVYLEPQNGEPSFHAVVRELNGKTALLHQFTESMRGRDDVLILCGRCHQLENIPRKGFDGAIDMLRAFLAPEPHDAVVDLGCGSGRTLLWNRDWGASMVGVDISPFFSAEARRTVDLLIADLRARGHDPGRPHRPGPPRRRPRARRGSARSRPGRSAATPVDARPAAASEGARPAPPAATCGN